MVLGVPDPPVAAALRRLREVPLEGHPLLDDGFVCLVDIMGDDQSVVQAMVDAGAPEYKAMCAHCHGGVGEARAYWAEGMRPHPPALAEVADQWSAAEVFWLVKHGAKMTGMPAFGPTHDDATVWNIAAFVKALPAMPQAQYAAYSSEHGGGQAEGDHTHAPGTPEHDD